MNCLVKDVKTCLLPLPRYFQSYIDIFQSNGVMPQLCELCDLDCGIICYMRVYVFKSSTQGVLLGLCNLYIRN